MDILKYKETPLNLHFYFIFSIWKFHMDFYFWWGENVLCIACAVLKNPFLQSKTFSEMLK